MVARITFPGRLENALNYHEQKVHKGTAQCLHAENFLLDARQLSFSDKLNRFTNQIELNPEVKTQLLHASLNFDPSEKLTIQELVAIATRYMDKIGFSEQPYLVYQHEDAGHPHIHIISPTIRNNGSPIYVHNIGKNQSAKARIEIEEEFGLVRAVGRNNNQAPEIPSLNIEKVLYGKAETKRSITNLLDAVITHYKYTSLSELNAILQLGNVMADRGKEGGRIHRTNGLVYRVLDTNGNKIGKPIKSSSIYSKPTMKQLEKNFTKNKILRHSKRNNLKKEIFQILGGSTSILQFITDLKQNRIDTVLRRNASGFIYGITFIDHKSKSVFNGGDLDKHLTAAAIQKALIATLEKPKHSAVKPNQYKQPATEKSEEKKHYILF